LLQENKGVPTGVGMPLFLFNFGGPVEKGGKVNG